jgi:formate dehydrogenase subunit delta
MNRISGEAAGEAAHGSQGHEHGGQGHDAAKHLVRMANDIGHFFRAEPEREDAIAGIANHIAKFWTKRMRDKLGAEVQSGGNAGLDELPFEALRRLAAQNAAA